MCAPEDHRFVECPQCEGAGEICVGTDWVYEAGCGFAHEDAIMDTCPECKGTGSVLEALPLVDEDDLDEWIGENLAEEIDRQEYAREDR